MHLYLITRGEKFFVDEFINQLRGKWLPMENENKLPLQIQIGVRPIQLWEIAYPKEHHDVVLNSILKGNPPMREEYKSMDKYLKLLRYVLKLQEVGDYKKSLILPLPTDHIDLIAIGTKDDGKFKHPKFGEIEGI